MSRHRTFPFGAVLPTGAVLAAAAAVFLLADGHDFTLPTPTEPASDTLTGVYERDLFGDGWADLDGDGCDTRQEILARDATRTVMDGCDLIYGVLLDPYTAVTLVVTDEDRAGVHIDHVIPLSYAWQHGADQWTDRQRLEFANDPINLIAVEGSVNMSKGDSGPSEWQPPDRTFWCEYAQVWAGVLAEYPLTLPTEDQAWLDTACPTTTAGGI